MLQETLATAAAEAQPVSGSDYDYVRRAVEFMTVNWRRHPEVDEVAAHVGLSPSHFHHLFRRWAGLSPNLFMQALTIDRARELVRNSGNVLDASLELGLSGPSRLHDLFVKHEAMSPGEWKIGGAGLKIRWAFHDSPFGRALVMATPRGLCGVGFSDGDDRAALEDMTGRWPRADFVEDFAATEPLARRAFDRGQWAPDQPLRVVLIGTDFQIRVWESLLSIPLGKADTYANIARKIGQPTAARAVGAAVGRNPISFCVPCHRVLGKTGALTGYHWGLTRKQAMLGWEAGPLEG